MQGIIKRIDSIVGLIESGRGSIGKLLVDEELYNRVLAIVTEFQGLAQVPSSSPRGTVGKLIYDDAVYRQVQGTLTRVDTIVADLQNGQGRRQAAERRSAL